MIFDIQAIGKLSDLVLLESAESLIREERNSTLRLLHHLREMNRRKLFGGYASLFDFLKAHGYDGGSAQRRIDAMRLLTDFPEAEVQIQSGELNLSVAAQAETFFRQEAKALEKPLARAEKKEILESLLGKSTREAERKLLQLTRHPEVHFAERVRPAGENHSELKLLVSDEALRDLEALRGLLAHKHPRLSYGELLGVIAKMALEKLSPAREPKRRRRLAEAQGAHGSQSVQDSQAAPEQSVLPAPEARSQSRPLASDAKLPHFRKPPAFRRRAIPAAVKRAVFQRDGSACTFRDEETGRVCGSRYFPQLHHIIAWAEGGPDTVANLTVHCFNHNQRRGIEAFGLRAS